jgi:hypothetical protein
MKKKSILHFSLKHRTLGKKKSNEKEKTSFIDPEPFVV